MICRPRLKIHCQRRFTTRQRVYEREHDSRVLLAAWLEGFTITLTLLSADTIRTLSVERRVKVRTETGRKGEGGREGRKKVDIGMGAGKAVKVGWKGDRKESEGWKRGRKKQKHP